MEDSHNFNCHHKIKKKGDYFCFKCGCISYKGSYGIKPIKYNYKIEVDPETILENFKIQEKSKLSIDSEVFLNLQGLIKNYLNKRKKIIKKIRSFINKYKYKDKTYHFALTMLDYVVGLSNNERLMIPIDGLAVGCLILAIKFNEIDPTIPDLTYFQNPWDNLFFKIDEIRRYEIFCLKKIKYQLAFITSYDFIQNFLRNGIIFSEEDLNLNSKKKRNENYSNEFRQFSRIYAFINEILDLTMEDINYTKFSFFDIACACIYLSREIVKINKENIWNHLLEKIYKIKFPEFEKCYNFVKTNYFNIRNTSDIICLYINNEQSLRNKHRNSLPPSGSRGYVKDNGKDLKITETKKLNLETFSLASVNERKKQKSKSQDTTINFKVDLLPKQKLLLNEHLENQIDSQRNKTEVKSLEKVDKSFKVMQEILSTETNVKNTTARKRSFNIALNIPINGVSFSQNKVLNDSNEANEVNPSLARHLKLSINKKTTALSNNISRNYSKMNIYKINKTSNGSNNVSIAREASARCKSVATNKKNLHDVIKDLSDNNIEYSNEYINTHNNIMSNQTNYFTKISNKNKSKNLMREVIIKKDNDFNKNINSQGHSQINIDKSLKLKNYVNLSLLQNSLNSSKRNNNKKSEIKQSISKNINKITHTNTMSSLITSKITKNSNSPNEDSTKKTKNKYLNEQISSSNSFSTANPNNSVTLAGQTYKALSQQTKLVHNETEKNAKNLYIKKERNSSSKNFEIINDDKKSNISDFSNYSRPFSLLKKFNYNNRKYQKTINLDVDKSILSSNLNLTYKKKLIGMDLNNSDNK